ncbi:MAG: cyclopropane-fatty-acyl-phospholipid synthase family protein [Lamprobacter sp.]|uniref:cyclopropane-fatty-acyl-phospholipid synthase family protein n=1 Tax=Lamprobacter sp. TaxID=3100796 RepID=UPI002B25E21C|nr:cyclopropane-fatty-acyl-phospholipid synthase family protein [Lamprobacter sp.]MEA3641333.1 cyclopropane-fatty-acyl-phospholipid synthase family protein [Lamprobacter sp.]
MASDKTAEAALPRLQQPLFGPIFQTLLKPVIWPITQLFDRIAAGQLRLRLGGRSYLLESDRDGPQAEIDIRRPLRMARRLATKGHLGLGESWMAGDWDSPDPTALLHLLAVNEHRWRERQRGGPLHQLLSPRRHQRRSNTRTGSRRNIAYHYDLGNDFYQLWLDPSMTYSSAVYAEPALEQALQRSAQPAPATTEDAFTGANPAAVQAADIPAAFQTSLLSNDDEDQALIQAQQIKYQRLLAMLDAKPGQHLLEIGCGWGAMAEAAAERGLRLTGITLSEEQLAWARARFQGSALGSQIALRLQDYRDVTETFDHIVSIEMFEAVGEDYWPTYMETLRERLRPGGTAALQVITIADDIFDDYKASPDFIQHYIFPGGMLPTVDRFDAAAQAAGLEITERGFYGKDYARTLRTWHRRFLERQTEVRALGYDERFLRMWRYYLSYCEAGFLDDRIDVMQVALQHRATL